MVTLTGGRSGIVMFSWRYTMSRNACDDIQSGKPYTDVPVSTARFEQMYVRFDRVGSMPKYGPSSE
jgi:hypothetical protein